MLNNWQYLAAFVLLLVAWLYWQTRQKYTFWSSRGVPGPSPSFPLGNAIAMFQVNRSELDTKWTSTYGKLVGFYQGTRPQLLVTEPTLIKDILVKDFVHFINRPDVNFYHEMWNENMFNATGTKWRRLRAIVSPAFTSGKLRAMNSLMDRCITKLEHYLESRLAGGDSVEFEDTKKIFSGFTIDVIAATSFAVDVDANSSTGETHPFVRYGNELFDINRLRALVAFAFPKTLIKLFGVETFFSPEPFNFFINLSQEIFKQRKCSSVKRNDFVQLLLDAEIDEADFEGIDYYESIEKDDTNSNEDLTSAKKKSLTETEMVSTALLFFIAGFETTASTICHLIYLFAKNPSIQETLHSEIIKATAHLDDTTSDEYFDTVINEIPYLDATIKEALRLYPPLVDIFRRVSTDGYHLGGIPLPRGCIVEISAYAVQHNAEFYPEPEQFKPERFLPENRHFLVPYTFLPFGQGPRNCAGMRFALQEIKLFLVKIMQQYRFEVTAGTPEELTFKRGSPMLQTQTFPIKICKRTV